MNNGWIKLHRSLLDWEWYSDMNVRVVFIHCLLKANCKDVKYKGKDILRGSFATGLELLSRETGLTVAQIRVTLNKLKMTSEITIQTSAEGSIISITNYDLYQSNDKQNDKQTASDITNKQQTNDKPIASNNNNKKDKNEENKEKDTIVSKKKVEIKLLAEKPDDVSQQIWDEWQLIKKNKKQTMTVSALQKFIDLAKNYGMSTQQLIEYCISKSWASATEEYLKNNGFKPVCEKEPELEFVGGFNDN